MILPLIIAAAALPGIEDMRWNRRLLVVAGDATLVARQHAVIAEWQRGADARDLTVITVTGDRVTATRDSAAALRRRYGLNGAGVVLVGKDGGVKLRSPGPIAADVLATTIDGMPMRRAGQR